MIEVEKLVQAGNIDYIVIESSGKSEPIPVAQTFTYVDDDLGINLSELTTLDTMVTVVDANRFWHDFSSGESLLDRKQGTDEMDTREVVDLLIDQIEFANVLVLNKVDLIDSESVMELKAVLHKLNPGKRPFHPERWNQWLENWPEDVVRAKGFFWLATRNDMTGLLSQAGPSIIIQGAGEWIASYPKQEIEQILKEEPEILKRWDEEYGDRMTELVLIGVNMIQKKIETTLNDCLLTDEKMKTDWTKLPDPIPTFSF